TWCGSERRGRGRESSRASDEGQATPARPLHTPRLAFDDAGMANPVRGFFGGLMLPLRGLRLVLAPRFLALALAPIGVGLLAAGLVILALWRQPDLLLGLLWDRPAAC